MEVTTSQDLTPKVCGNCNGTGAWPVYPPQSCSCPLGRVYERETKERAVRERRAAVWSHADIPRRFARYTLESHPDQVSVAAINGWAMDNDGTNLLISGPVGTGKTGLAVGLVRTLVEDDVSSIAFWSVPYLLDQMRPPALDDPMVDLQRARVLVLDDLGVEKASDWVRERIYVLVNARYEAMSPTIVTSNASLASLSDTLGERTVSRFAEHLHVVTLKGRDRRAQ